MREGQGSRGGSTVEGSRNMREVEVLQYPEVKEKLNEQTNHEAFVPLLDLLLGEASVLLQEVEIFFGELRLRALYTHLPGEDELSGDELAVMDHQDVASTAPLQT